MVEFSTMDSATEAAEIAASVFRGPASLNYKLSSGVVLSIIPVPPMALREAAIQGSPPMPPMVHNEDRNRDEPNPIDPDYIAALQDYQNHQFFRVADVLMMLGTKIESVPDDMFKPEDEDWIEMLEATGIRIAAGMNKYARRLAWLRLYAARTEADISIIMARVIALSGVTEVEVQRAAAAFLRNEKW